MKPLVLTGWSLAEFTKSNFADLAVDFPFRFVGGQLPAPDELAAYLGPRTDQRSGRHWSDFTFDWEHSKNGDDRDLGLIEFCRQYETVELWFDTRPNAQLLLVWLLDHFQSYPDTIELWMDPGPNDQLQLICLLQHLRAHREIASRLSLVQAHVPWAGKGPRCWQHGSCRLSKSLRIISNWRAGRGAPLVQGRRRTGSACWRQI